MTHFREVASKFSPQLKGELLLYTCRSWTASVFYLEAAPERIMMALAQAMSVHFYAKNEELHQQSLCMVEQGTIASAGRILTPGDAFNIDCIVSHKLWRHFPRTISLTYSMVLALDRTQLLQVGGRDPCFRASLKRAAAKIAIMRSMAMCAERAKQEQRISADRTTPGLQEVFIKIVSEADAEHIQEMGPSMSTQAVIRAAVQAMSSTRFESNTSSKAQLQSDPSLPELTLPTSPPATPAPHTIMNTGAARSLPRQEPGFEGMSTRRLESLEKRLETSLDLVQGQLQEVRTLLREAAAQDELARRQCEGLQATNPSHMDL
eukprot:CAMPEP_0115363214 /NCGR_PEP_ID=MMETSP0270-20121206/103113_1 /TAXON_ID=71861 /ORGANISM="Scrippsiella trochoidea, Strain CCMP3099" /LENGTH=319 /DNA_ID=CAMNT_0002785825 /DNA_START=9 /DNA_END=968 /DNA_ORIENTATION=-